MIADFIFPKMRKPFYMLPLCKKVHFKLFNHLVLYHWSWSRNVNTICVTVLKTSKNFYEVRRCKLSWFVHEIFQSKWLTGDLTEIRTHFTFITFDMKTRVGKLLKCCCYFLKLWLLCCDCMCEIVSFIYEMEQSQIS